MRRSEDRAAASTQVLHGRWQMGLENIHHFVVLMLENRSFDHMFSFRRDVEGLTKRKHVNRLDPSKPVDNGNPEVAAAEGADFEIVTKHALGPFHNVVDVNVQLAGSIAEPGATPAMNGFVESYHEAFTQDVRREPSTHELAVGMQSFTPGALPAISQLADSFALCDHWFCEVPGPTHPNRLYVHAGTSAGFAHNVFDRTLNLVTIYELLERHHQTWAT